MKQQLITMTNKESSRYETIKKLIKKEINGTEAAKQLFLSVRQVKNLKIRVKKQKIKRLIPYVKVMLPLFGPELTSLVRKLKSKITKL